MNWPSDFINKIICGDNLSVMKKMPDESIDMVITSPPYWGLRDYGFEQIFGGDPNCDHDFGIIHRRSGDKSGPHGSKSILGSTKKAQQKVRKGEPTKTCSKCQAWKGQLGLEPTPELYIEHLAEIFNEVKRILKKEGTFWLNIGDTYWGGKGRSAHGDPERHIKRLREGKTINKPHQEIGAPGQIKPGDDKHEFIQPKSLCMIPERLAWSLIQNGWILRNKIPWIKPNCMPFSGKDRYTNKYELVYYFVKSQRNYFDLDSVREPHKGTGGGPGFGANILEQNRSHEQREHPGGKNPGDVWIIPTIACPFPGVHFATFPEKLCKKAIIPGSPEDGIVLDPFCGVGTALYVAKELRRRFIGIDIKKEYCELAEKRLAQGVL